MWIAAPPSTPATRIPPPAPGSGGPWIGIAIVLSLVWLGFQFTPGGRRKWSARWGLVAPLLSVVASDISFLVVRPIVIRVTAWRFRRQLDERP